MTEASAPVAARASAHGIEHGQAQMGAAPLAGGDAAHHAGAVGDRLLGVEGALGAGEALADDPRPAIDEDRHQPARPMARTTLAAASPRSSAAIRSIPAPARIALPFSTLVPSSRTTSGSSSDTLAGRGDDAFGDHVAAHDAAEDVDQDAAHVGVREDDLEGLGDPLAGGAAADIEEVGRLRAVPA